jgi:hypothetical protein
MRWSHWLTAMRGRLDEAAHPDHDHGRRACCSCRTGTRLPVPLWRCDLDSTWHHPEREQSASARDENGADRALRGDALPMKLPCSRPNGAPVTRKCKRIDDAVPRPNRGAQPGNQNALRHGKRSATRIMASKLSTARLKSLPYAVVMLDMVDEKNRHRLRPLRPDQVELLRHYDPQLSNLLRTTDGGTFGDCHG